jgi:hypothetical protein
MFAPAKALRLCRTIRSAEGGAKFIEAISAFEFHTFCAHAPQFKTDQKCFAR